MAGKTHDACCTYVAHCPFCTFDSHCACALAEHAAQLWVSQSLMQPVTCAQLGGRYGDTHSKMPLKREKSMSNGWRHEAQPPRPLAKRKLKKLWHVAVVAPPEHSAAAFARSLGKHDPGCCCAGGVVMAGLQDG